MTKVLELNKLAEIARAAGQAVMDVYQSPHLGVEYKADNSPLTKADLASHDIICAELARFTPNTPILSEEEVNTPWSTRKSWERYWLVDPLDGTKEFVRRNGEFTVNIALIEKGEPVLGVVYAPAKDKLYLGGEGATATLNGEPIRVRSRPDDQPLQVVGSRSHQSPHLIDYVEKMGVPYELVGVGSSLKICFIADGTADLYPRLGPTSEWDTAAAHAILRAAGGEIYTLKEDLPLRYNQKRTLMNPNFVARAVLSIS
ncbi:3'(2'),5'-bisphosphate nucleotidase [Idiomarina tyrosinivorans]|uniref:3'(2'),5'-bisphosphate nucleotidase CysQ n=1 Tax=Idiomarina tyrosinivorans TaxID=1445662 RepID=A0A432ZQP3_9GAMM|nr:3'(2'),5'-bisphosphate nucleotidase CysQ [Idiomarina tyrosinivorans]RUO80255.1 3'(2'),5'-bisphosphate nucleotidase [Idiomarina tyrosinivorans]